MSNPNFVTKAFYLLTVCLSFGLNSVAQEHYFQAPELKDYEGKWIGVSESDTLYLNFEFKKHYQYGSDDSNMYVDAIIGNHYFIKNGAVESSSVKYPMDAKNASILIGKNSHGSIFANLNEEGRKNGHAKISFQLVSDDASKATLKIDRIVQPELNILSDRIKYDNQPESKLTAIAEWKLTRIE